MAGAPFADTELHKLYVYLNYLLRKFQGEAELKPTSHGKGKTVEEEKERLPSIIDRLNERFGTELNETDKLSRDQIKEDMIKDEDLAQKARNNSKENFKFSYEKAFMDFVISRMSQNKKFFMKMLENNDFKTLIMGLRKILCK